MLYKNRAARRVADGSVGDAWGHQSMTAAQRAQRPSALAAGS